MNFEPNLVVFYIIFSQLIGFRHIMRRNYERGHLWSNTQQSKIPSRIVNFVRNLEEDLQIGNERDFVILGYRFCARFWIHFETIPDSFQNRQFCAQFGGGPPNRK